jgi:hypothetical protein
MARTGPVPDARHRVFNGTIPGEDKALNNDGYPFKVRP